MILLHGVGDEEHELLCANPDAVAVFQRRATDKRSSIQLSPVAAVKVLQRRLGTGEVDADVSTGQHGIVECHVAHRAPADDNLIAGQVDLL